MSSSFLRLAHTGAVLSLLGASSLWADSSATIEYRSTLPFDMPSTEVLRQSEHKVFPHWHNFSVSYDNQAPDQDRWATNIFSLSGAFKPDNDDFANRKIGGFTRERPLPRAPLAGDDWAVQDAMQEVRYAVAAGLDGFYFNILGLPSEHDGQYEKVVDHLEAARRVDPGFKILPAVDSAAAISTPQKKAQARETFYAMLMSVKDHPSILHTADGRMVFGSFGAHFIPPEDWQWVISRMEANGVRTAFIPVLMGWRQHYEKYLPVSAGIGEWGSKYITAAQGLKDFPGAVRDAGKFSLFPVAPQQMRPKSMWYEESSNSLMYRTQWETAIQNHADWIQIVTWNDYGEGTEVIPSTGIQYAFLDLTAYYTTWLKTGSAPAIKRDTLYYFHRVHSAAALPTPGHEIMKQRNGDQPDDMIELLAFLREPGTLAIEVGGERQTMEAPAGMTSFRVPLREGTPVFTLTRGGREVIHLTSAFAIKNEGFSYQNMLYHAGGSNRPPVPGVESYQIYYQK